MCGVAYGENHMGRELMSLANSWADLRLDKDYIDGFGDRYSCD
jgi:hypothetical protein